jgi:cytochrome P450
MLAYILHEPALHTILRAEVDLACSEGMEGLPYRLEHCPRLKAVLLEVLRLTGSTSTIRSVTDTTHVGDKVLRSGTDILIPYRQLHLNESVFGPKPSHFDPNRFLSNKDLSRSPSFKPFGGGSTYCPGRNIAQREILIFIALALHRFDLSLTVAKQGLGTRERGSVPRFPRIDSKKLCLGIQEPMKGEDVIVNVRMRKQ